MSFQQTGFVLTSNNFGRGVPHFSNGNEHLESKDDVNIMQFTYNTVQPSHTYGHHFQQFEHI
jgi:hypothetical protein